MAVRVLIALVLAVTATARAQPKDAPIDVAAALRAANAAALAGDWDQVASLVDPLRFMTTLPHADAAETHRLAGLAAYERKRNTEAERELLAYLLLEPDATLDATLYPPELIAELQEVHKKHIIEIESAKRPRTRRSGLLSIIPVFAQVQNGQRGKAIAVGVVLGASAVTWVGSYALLHYGWCPNTGGACDANPWHSTRAAATARDVNIGAFAVFVAMVAYGVIDGRTTYGKVTSHDGIRASISPVSRGALVGISGAW